MSALLISLASLSAIACIALAILVAFDVRLALWGLVAAAAVAAPLSAWLARRRPRPRNIGFRLTLLFSLILSIFGGFFSLVKSFEVIHVGAEPSAFVQAALGGLWLTSGIAAVASLRSTLAKQGVKPKNARESPAA